MRHSAQTGYQRFAGYSTSYTRYISRANKCPKIHEPYCWRKLNDYYNINIGPNYAVRHFLTHLGPSDVYMRQWSGSSLVQALSPVKHQASISTNTSVLSSWHLLEIHTLLHTLIPRKLFENIFCTISAILPRPTCVKGAGAHTMMWC